MAAPKGNQFWKARASSGASPRYATPESLWEDCLEYFQWVEDNPLESAEKVTFQGVGSLMVIPKMRAMSVIGLCNFLGINSATWYGWRGKGEGHREDLLSIITQAEEIIRQQKFEGASADLLNPNIIARDLGLVDKREHAGPDGGPIQTINTNMTAEEAAQAYADTLRDQDS